MNLFLNYINKNYRMLKDEQLFVLLFRFNIEQLEGITFIKANGWKEEVLSGGQIRYWHPAVKDRNNIIGMSDVKKLNTSKDRIDIEREKTKHKFLRDKEEEEN